MRNHFGTDGIRGKANESLNAEMAFRIGRYLGYYLRGEEKAKVIIGRDTRKSGSMFEHAIASGLSSSGVDVYLLDICPTPCVAYLVRKEIFACGVMISASHNPFHDNGIKIFSSSGTKIERALEEKIEAYIYGESEIEYAIGDAIGEVIDYHQGVDEYLDCLEKLVPLDLTGKKIAIDPANGSACVTAEKLLKRMGADCVVINNTPNGLNINNQCGSTHPESLVELVKNGDYDIGFAFDGDADRLISVASDGQLIDGDKVLYCCGKYLKSINELTDNTIVTTVMANLGLFKKLDAEGINYKVTQVGDKYVFECMSTEGYDLGGEQSGHIIFRKCATTGDGLLTALELLKVMIKTQKSINELTDDLFIYPQLLVNVVVNDKIKAMKDEDVLAAEKKVTDALAGEGRILVRSSGTEPLVRVMVEARTDELCAKYVNEVVELIKKKNL